MAISKRLETIASFVPKGARFADIGTDHGYMPIYVLENDMTAYGILCDINKAPLALAQKNIQMKGFEKSLYAIRLGNGLEACLDLNFETLTISGMGAGLMLEILTSQKEKLQTLSRLILSPNTAPWLLRAHLSDYGFELKKEALVYENELYYEVLVFERDKVTPMSENEIFFGKYLPSLKETEAYFEKRKEKDFYKIEKMKLAKNKDMVSEEINRIKTLWKGFEHG